LPPAAVEFWPRLSAASRTYSADEPSPFEHDTKASHHADVDVELLVIPECPGSDEASELLRTALDDIGLAGTTFTVRVIDSDDAARGCRFAGSPAFVVDGLDLFESGTTEGSMACRVYTTPHGPRNLPALRDLRKALKEQAARAIGV
jgi:hypothetical protein